MGSQNVIHRTALMKAYFNGARCEDALRMFAAMGDAKDHIANALAMKCEMHSERQRFEAALRIYDGAQTKDAAMHILALSASTKRNDCKRVRDIHRSVAQSLSQNIQLSNALIASYAHFGDVAAAQSVFSAVSEKSQNAQSVATMLRAFLRNECAADALSLFGAFSSRSAHSQSQSGPLFALAPKACAALRDREKGAQIRAAPTLSAVIWSTSPSKRRWSIFMAPSETLRAQSRCSTLSPTRERTSFW